MLRLRVRRGAAYGDTRRHTRTLGTTIETKGSHAACVSTRRGITRVTKRLLPRVHAAASGLLRGRSFEFRAHRARVTGDQLPRFTTLLPDVHDIEISAPVTPRRRGLLSQ